MLIDYTCGKATSFIPYDIFTDTCHGRRFLRKKVDGYDVKTDSETNFNTGYNSSIEVKRFAVSALGVGQFVAISVV